MLIRCPKCRKSLATMGRIEFPCRHCGTMLRDPRAFGAEELENAVKILEYERECVLRQDTPECDRNCKECDLVQDTEAVISAYDTALLLLKKKYNDIIEER